MAASVIEKTRRSVPPIVVTRLINKATDATYHNILLLYTIERRPTRGANYGEKYAHISLSEAYFLLDFIPRSIYRALFELSDGFHLDNNIIITTAVADYIIIIIITRVLCIRVTQVRVHCCAVVFTSPPMSTILYA